MLFGKKLKLLKKPDPEKEKKLREQIEEEGGLEKGDIPAMIISALLIIVPIALVLLLLFLAIGFLFFS